MGAAEESKERVIDQALAEYRAYCAGELHATSPQRPAWTRYTTDVG